MIYHNKLVVYRNLFKCKFNTIDSKNIYKIKTDKIFCSNDKCLFYDDKYLYFKDKVHPSYHASKILSQIIY